MLTPVRPAGQREPHPARTGLLRLTVGTRRAFFTDSRVLRDTADSKEISHAPGSGEDADMPSPGHRPRRTSMQLRIPSRLLSLVLLGLPLVGVPSVARANNDPPPPCSRVTCRDEIAAMCGSLSGKAKSDCSKSV